MTRILVQRGSASASSNSNRSSSSSSFRADPPIAVSQVPTTVKDEENVEEVHEQVHVDQLSDCSGSTNNKGKGNDILVESVNSDEKEILSDELIHKEKVGNDVGSGGVLVKEYSGARIPETYAPELESSSGVSSVTAVDSPHPPPPPVPPPKPLSQNSNPRSTVPGSTNAFRIGSSRRASAWPVVSNRSSLAGSRPTSPRSNNDEGYNSADEQNPCFVASYDDFERERQFEIDIRRVKGFELKRMLEDGNCLFRAVADQVYGDSEAYDLVRQMCIDYMERERDHFSQFITEGFTSYCKRKRRDKVYGNNVEIQALSEMYNRPIHIYSYGTEPINIFHGSYNTDTPPIRLSYHYGNHYNSLVDPRRLAIGAGLGFSTLRGTNVDWDQIKAAIKAQQDLQIDNALVAEGRFYSDLALTEKEIERMAIEVSRAEYLADSTFKQQLNRRESSTSSAEPSSSGATGSSGTESKIGSGKEQYIQDSVLSSSSLKMVLSMGFSYLQVIEAYSIFGDDVDSIVCYLLEISNTNSSRRKGKATE